MAKPRPCSRSQACTPEAASRPNAEPPESATASMHSTVRWAGRAGRFRGCPARRRARRPSAGRRASVEPRSRSSRRASLASCALPTRMPATSVMRFLGTIFPGSGKASIREPYQINSRSHRRQDPPSRLRLPLAPTHLGAMTQGRDPSSRRPDRGAYQLSVTLCPAVGAALSRLSHRHVARTVCRRRGRTARPARDGGGGGAFRLRLFDGVRRAWRERERHRLADARLFGPLGIVAGIAIIVMGLHFLGVFPHRLPPTASSAWRW